MTNQVIDSAPQTAPSSRLSLFGSNKTRRDTIQAYLFLLPFLVVYLIFMVRATIDMLRYDVHGVLLTFTFVALIPFPLLLVLGITILIIWHYHKRDIVAGKRATR